MPEPKQKKLSIKQKKFVKAYVETGDKSVAYKKAYDTKGNPDTIYPEAVRTASLPQVKEAIELALVKHGITIDAAVAPIADGLKASKTFTVDESVVKVVDHSTRLKASGMALKLLGAEKNDTPANTINNFGNMLLQQKSKYDE